MCLLFVPVRSLLAAACLYSAPAHAIAYIARRIALRTAVHVATHEVSANRATLVLRDETHVSVTMYINYSDAMRLALAPAQSPAEFVLTHAAMTPVQFQREVDRAQRRFAADMRLQLPNGHRIALGSWKWPDASAVQTALRELAMGYMVLASYPAHEPPMELRADGTALQTISSVSVTFPAAFQRVLVVSYRPTQLWVEPSGAPTRIEFP